MARLTRLVVAMLLVLLVAGVGGCRRSDPPTLIQTDSGMVNGRVLDSGVKAWLGVPFAKPPVRELRWKEAQPITWKGVYNADRKMPECIQVLRPHNINHYFGEEATSEDCLYMNIWSPAGSDANARLPVIVFIYGGGGTLGSSGMANYDGEQVAKRGAVFVNFNYRVGVLGFMAHPELTKEQGGHSGNYGYLDQSAALKWIQRNIAAFGGDPAKVIISGQSAGAGSVAQQIFSPRSRGLFRGAAMFSACNYTTSNTPLAEAEATGLEIQKQLEAASLDDMRQIPADRILAIQNEFQVGRAVTGVRTSGVIDGYFMPDTKEAILKAGGASDVPIIASFTHDEANSPLKAAKTVAEYKAAAKELFKDAAEEFLTLYPVASDAEIPAVAQEAANDGAGLFNSCACASLQAQYHKSPAFLTVFSRKHPYVPGVKIADQDTATIGAYHTSEVPYYFGTQDAYNLFRPTRNWTPWDRELSQKMTAVLVAFARTGNPTTAGVQWPAWSAQAERYVNFGDTIALETVNRARLDFMAKHRPAPMSPGGAPRRFQRD
ncbi:MAG: carboxylesterase family protein [Acidobacteria bacterium]|nr:carboxylesterase family protein [Acidobacteriota bacterium]